MTNVELVEVLKTEAEKNPATKAALMVFCVRKRPRRTLTLVGLEQRMQKEGYRYSRKDYEPFIRILEFVGVGVLDFDGRGRLKGLKGIKISFKSIGDAVFSDGQIVAIPQRNRFTAIPKPKVLVAKPGLTLSLGVEINGKQVNIPIPKELNNEDLAILIAKFKEA